MGVLGWAYTLQISSWALWAKLLWLSVMENNWECRLLRAVMEDLSEKMTWHLLSEGQKRTRPLKLGRSMSKCPEAGKSLAHVGIEKRPRWQGRNEL